MTTIKLKNGSGAPLAGDLVVGEPALDLTNKRLYTEDSGGTVIEVGTNPGEDVTFADNRKAIFGAGSDLKIYHDGSDSYIDDTGTGRLRLRGAADIILAHPTNGETYATFSANGANTFYYDNAAKLATTSTGIDVTGTVTADGVSSDGNISMSGAGTGSRYVLLGNETSAYAGSLVMQAGGGSAAYGGSIIAYGHSHASKAGDIVAGISSGSGGAFRVNTSGIDSGGDVLVVEASGNVGIGTSSPSSVLHLSTSNDPQITLTDTGFGASADITGSNGNLRLNSQTATIFDMADSEVMRIDASGNVGILTSSPASYGQLAVNGTASILSNNALRFYNSANNNWAFIDNPATDGTAFLRFATGGGEAMRIDASGNLLVGTTDDVVQTNSGTGNGGIVLRNNNYVAVASDGSAALELNRLASDGEIINFRKDGTTVGSIGTTGGDFYITKSGSNQTGIYFNELGMLPMKSGSISDNTRDIGQSTYRWDDIYATNGTIQTSDRNEKQDIEALSDAEQRVAVACKGLLRKWRWIDSVEAKGDEARIHFGIIAQDLQAAFEAEGLDAGRYAMFISTTWWESTEVIPAVEAQEAVVDEEGNVVEEAVEAQEERTVVHTHNTAEEAPEGSVERTRLGVRYSELLAFIIAAI
jgi:hypothetical protein